MKFTNTYRYVVLKQVMFLILFLIILVCMIKIDLEYLKQEVRIVFAFVIYFAGGFQKQLELKKFKLFFLCIMHKEEGEENDKPRVVQSKQKEIM